MNIANDNKRIAKNTILLYVRMLFSMLVSLYTSRVILSTLGAEDFGIYSIVGGVVIILSFLNSSMSGATSRFLTYELGVGNKEKLRKVFSASLNVHFLLGLLILILGETIGLWFLENKLVIPAERMLAAHWVYQFSLLSGVLTVVAVPYSASIIANEKIDAYAFIEILSVLLKLLIVFLLVLASWDKLIVYGFFMLCSFIITTLITIFYCINKFEGCRYQAEWDKKTIYPILSFSGWDLLGNLSVVGRTQGVNILLNMFFGPILNAASGVAAQVQNVVGSFGSNILVAVRPQIVKSYAAKDYNRTASLVYNVAKFTYILLLFLSLPLIFETNLVLHLWLKNVPEYTVVFCRCVLIFNFFVTITATLLSALHATGRIKRPSIANGCIYLLVLPVSYFSFKFGGKPEVAYLCNIVLAIMAMISCSWILSRYMKQFSFKLFICKSLFPCLVVTIISVILTGTVQFQMNEGILRFILVGCVSSFSILLLTYALALDNSMRFFVKNKIKNFISKK